MAAETICKWFPNDISLGRLNCPKDPSIFFFISRHIDTTAIVLDDSRITATGGDSILQLLDHAGTTNFAFPQNVTPQTAALWWNRLQPSTAQERNEATLDAKAFKPVGVQARTWTQFDDRKLSATVSLICQLARFCRLRVPVDSQAGKSLFKSRR